MKVWLPYIQAGSGTDIFTRRLAKAIEEAGHQTVLSPYPHWLQYFPWLLRIIKTPPGTEITITNTWNGFAFRRKRTKLVTIEHLCIFDPDYLPYRSFAQAVFHETMVRQFEKLTIKKSDAIIAISNYIADSVNTIFNTPVNKVIYNGIDAKYFSPVSNHQNLCKKDFFRILFVGNLTKRKGADLLPEIMNRLGSHYELYFCSIRRTSPITKCNNMKPLGSLSQEQIRDAYREADIVLFPTRSEGFGYAAAEAMACGTPVVASNCTSLPEIIEDGVTGRLCPVDDVEAFVDAIQELADSPEKLQKMGRLARLKIENSFSEEKMLQQYLNLFRMVLLK